MGEPEASICLAATAASNTKTTDRIRQITKGESSLRARVSKLFTMCWLQTFPTFHARAESQYVNISILQQLKEFFAFETLPIRNHYLNAFSTFTYALSIQLIIGPVGAIRPRRRRRQRSRRRAARLGRGW